MAEAYLNGLISIKQFGSGFHLCNIDTKDEAQVNADLAAVVRALAENPDMETVRAQLQQQYPNTQSDTLEAGLQKSLEQLAQWGFVTAEANESELIDLSRPGIEFPVDQVYLELTKRCNLTCAHCYNNSSPSCDLTEGELNTQEYKAAISRIAEQVGPMHYIVTGGEPLLRKDMFDILEHIRACGGDFSLFTNGTMWDQEMVDRLCEYKPRFVAISLDGPDDETNALIRGPGAYSKTAHTIKLMSDKGIKVRINATLIGGVTDTHEGIASMLDRFEELGMHSVAASGITATGRGGDIEQYHVPDEVAAVLRDCFARYNARDDVEAQKTVYESANNATYCGLGVSTFMMLNNGDIVLCPMLYDTEHIVGHVSDDLATLWNDSPIFKSIREHKYDESGACNSCEVTKTCLGGCRANVYEREGTFVGPDTWQCGFYDQLDHARNPK